MRKEKYAEIMAFIEKDSFETENDDFRVLRKRNFAMNFNFIIGVSILSNVTGLSMSLGGSFFVKIYIPLVFKSSLWMYAPTWIIVSWVVTVFGNMASNGSLILSSMMTYISNEFKIVGMMFEKSLKKLENTNELDDDFHRELIKITERHQELIR